jgi:RimJ/RimL family protein N-acetyltransferase
VATGGGSTPQGNGSGGLPGEIRLRDGTPALIWPVLPSDRKVLREGFAGLSDRTRYRRFLSAVPQLTEPMLRRLVDDVDGVDHVALILLALPVGGDETVAGVGRLVRYATDSTAADIAVTVADQWQGRGVGTALVNALLARRPEGVTRLRTMTAADNVASLAMLAAAGPVSTRTEHGVVEVCVDVSEGSSRS